MAAYPNRAAEPHGPRHVRVADRTGDRATRRDQR